MTAIAIVSYKGGVGKTTTAVHLAHYLHEQNEPVTLIDGDPMRWALKWSERGQGFPFPTAYLTDSYQATEWIVVDSQAHPDEDDIREIARRVDLVVIPVKDIESLEGAILMRPILEDTKHIAVVNMAPPYPQTDGDEMREALEANGVRTAARTLRHTKGYVTAKHEGTSLLHCSQRGSKAAWLEFAAVAREVVRYAEGQ